MKPRVARAPPTDETRRKISNSLKKRCSSREYKEKISNEVKERWKDPAYREKVIKSLKERYAEPEIRESRRISAKAQWEDENFRKKMHDMHSLPENREKMKNAAKQLWSNPEKKEKWIIKQKEIRSAPEIREKMRKAAKDAGSRPEVKERMSRSQKIRFSDPEQIEKISGQNGNNWRGGISFEPYCPKFNKDLKRRVRAFFDRRCVICGKSEAEDRRALSVHHVEYNKEACCDGKTVHFAALCWKCHAHTNYARERWEAMLHRIIDEIYGGRSYFTKDEWLKICGEWS
jgi:hypothetical protein